MLVRTTETFLSSATSSWNHPHKKRHFVDGERQKEIGELAKPLKNECRLSKRRARNRKRANERRTSDTSAQSNVKLGKRRLQQRDTYTSFPVKRRYARIESVNNAQRRRIAAQSPEERDARLQQLRTAREQTFAIESMDERQTHLQQLRSAQQQRIAAKHKEEEAGLQQLRTAQQQRIAAESGSVGINDLSSSSINILHG